MLFTEGLIQGPLAGVSCAPFRKLAWQFGPPRYACSEMLSAKHIFSGARQKRRYSYKAPQEGPLCVQLAGYEPEVLAVAAQKAVVEWGASLIDLNAGCPQPKIRKKKLGSWLLAESNRLYVLLKAMKEAVTVPVTVKIRVDRQAGTKYNQSVAKAAEDAGVDAIIVHGRHWTERYDISVSFEDIAAIKQSVAIPVIGNGDVKDVASARAMFDATGCDAVMISRASMGQPWLFNEIAAGLAGRPFERPSLAQIGGMYLQHISELVALEAEKPAILQARQFAKYYTRHHSNPSNFIDKINQLVCYEHFERLVIEQFG